MRIGIFAGTFDPIHIGHIEFSRSAITQANLDKVIIVAEKEPYRKKPHAAWDHRQAMIERATEELENVDHDYNFAAKLSHQHTMKDMLIKAQKHYGKDNEYWFLVGSDIFEHVNKWHDVITKNNYGGFIVALRDGHSSEWIFEKIRDASFDDDQIVVLASTYPHISSSLVRSRIANSDTVTDMSDSVLEYITQHSLYS